MIKLHDGGVYLVNGDTLIPENEQASAAIQAATGHTITKDEAAKKTIAYGILSEHNTSGSMEKLKIKFDKLTDRKSVV